MSHDSSYHTVHGLLCFWKNIIQPFETFLYALLSSCDTGATESLESEAFGMSISFSCAQIPLLDMRSESGHETIHSSCSGCYRTLPHLEIGLWHRKKTLWWVMIITIFV